MRGRILQVEDNPDNSKLVAWILTDAGYQLETVTSAEAALAWLEAVPFDAVLMDIRLPGMDGIEATRCIRERLGLIDLPIIAITAHAFKDELAHLRTHGLTIVLTKPVDATELLETIQAVLLEGSSGKNSRCRRSA